MRRVLLIPCFALPVVVAACGALQEDQEVPATSVPGDIATAGVTPSVPDPTPTRIPGLTDTGYLAVDGGPLYAECMAPGAPLPPQIPTPLATQEPLPTPDPSLDPNADRTPPTGDEVPPFDFTTLTPADSSTWPVYESACYGYSLRIPPGWEVDPWRQAGYGQGEYTTLRVPGSRDKIEIAAYYTPVDQLQITPAFGLAEDEYLLSGPTILSQRGLQGVESIVHGSRQPSAGIAALYTFRLRDDWYLALAARLTSPYDVQAAEDARSLVTSLEPLW